MQKLQKRANYEEKTGFKNGIRWKIGEKGHIGKKNNKIVKD